MATGAGGKTPSKEVEARVQDLRDVQDDNYVEPHSGRSDKSSFS
jgi:hypothetical protein